MSITSVYSLSSGSATLANPSYSPSSTDESGIYVTDGASLTVANVTITSSASGSDVTTSDKYGDAAAILADSSGTIAVTGGSITTSGTYANGLFATGTSSAIVMSNGSIVTSGANAHGVDVTYGGSITLTDVDITTSAANSSALATDYGGGTVTATGGVISASGAQSAGIYSTGVISVNGATVTSGSDNGAVIDVNGAISLANTALTGAENGLMIHNTTGQSYTATATISGGSLTAKDGDAIYVTGATAKVTLSGGVTISDTTGYLVDAVSSSTVNLVINGQELNGTLIADSGSTINLTVENISGLSTISKTISGTTAMLATAADANVARMYEAAFGRTPDASGLAAWEKVYDAGGISLAGLANAFIGSSEFSSDHGTVSNAQFVTQLYTEALGRTADTAGYNAWLSALNSGALTQAQVMVGFVQSSECVSKWAANWLITI
jgi:hypothetical protein